MAQLPSLRVGLTLDSATFIQETRQVGAAVNQATKEVQAQGAQMSGAMKQVGSAAGALRTGLGALGVGFGVLEVRRFVENTFAAADALKGAADTAGISAEALQRWRFAAEQSGSNAASMDIAIKTLNERLGDFARTGGGVAAKALEQLGVSSRISSGELQGTTAIMAAVVDALAGIEDPAKRASLATDAFGRAAGPQMAGLLNEGVAGISRLRESAAALTDEQIASADEIGDRWAKLTGQITTRLQSLTIAMADFATRGAENNKLLADSYDRMGNDVLTSVTSMVTAVDQQLNNRLSQAAESSASSTVGIALKWRELYDELVGQSIVPDMVNEIQGWFERLQGPAMVDPTQKALDETRASFQGLSSDLRVPPSAQAALRASSDRIAEDQKQIIIEASAPREALRDTESLTAEMEGVWQGLGQSIQSTFADTYEDIFTGGLTSFEDFAESIKDIFVRLAAEVAALMTSKALFGQLSGAGMNFGSLFGPSGGAAGFGQGTMTSSGVFIPAITGPGTAGGFGQGQMTPGGVMIPAIAPARPTGFFHAPTTPGMGAAFGSAAGGALGGLAIGQTMYPGHTGATIGGGIGGAAGAAGGSFFGPGGAMLGGLAGGALGSFIGRQFGAGKGQDNKVMLQGMLGAGAGGSGAAAQLVQGIDAQVRGLLTTAQEVTADLYLKRAAAVAVQYDKEMSANDMARLTAGRLGPVAESLGFNVAAVTRGSAEQQQAQFGEALGAKKAIDDLRGSLTPFATQTENLREQMDEAWNTAAKYGIALDGVVEGQASAYEALERQQRAQYITAAQAVGASDDMGAALGQLQIQMEQAAADADALGISTANLGARHAQLAAALERQQRSQFITVAQSAGAMTPLNAALELLNVQMQETQAQAIALGVPTGNLAARHNELARALVEQFAPAVEQVAQQVAQAVDRTEGFRLAESVGAMSSLNVALELLNIQMQDTAARAAELGVPLRNLSQTHNQAAQALVRQHRLQAFQIAETIGTMTPLETALEVLNIEMQDQYAAAVRLGIATNNLAKTHNEAARATVRQHQAQLDAMALSITNPFEELLEPLRALGIELDRSLMDPLEQFSASAQNFRDIARQAAAGSTTAIAQLDEAAQGFIDTAEAVGASPGRARAVQEVQAVLGPIQNQITSAQAQASRGVEGAIWGANQRVVDTLGELVTVGRQQIEEMRRLQRQLS